MALTRKFLSAMGIEAEKVEEIITAYAESLNSVKEERDRYKADSEKLAEVTKERDKYKLIAENKPANDFEDKYNSLKTEFDNFKADVLARETKAKKDSAYGNLLKESGIPEKHIPAILKVSDTDSLAFENDGSVKDKQKILDTIKSEWSDFIPAVSRSGADVATPPSNTTGDTFSAMPLAQKMTYANEHPNDEQVKTWLSK